MHLMCKRGVSMCFVCVCVCVYVCVCVCVCAHISVSSAQTLGYRKYNLITFKKEMYTILLAFIYWIEVEYAPFYILAAF